MPCETCDTWADGGFDSRIFHGIVFLSHLPWDLSSAQTFRMGSVVGRWPGCVVSTVGSHPSSPFCIMDPRANSSSTTLCEESIAKTEHIVTISNEPSGDVPSEEWSDLVLRPLIKHKSTSYVHHDFSHNPNNTIRRDQCPADLST